LYTNDYVGFVDKNRYLIAVGLVSSVNNRERIVVLKKIYGPLSSIKSFHIIPSMQDSKNFELYRFRDKWRITTQGGVTLYPFKAGAKAFSLRAIFSWRITSNYDLKMGLGFFAGEGKITRGSDGFSFYKLKKAANNPEYPMQFNGMDTIVGLGRYLLDNQKISIILDGYVGIARVDMEIFSTKEHLNKKTYQLYFNQGFNFLALFGLSGSLHFSLPFRLFTSGDPLDNRSLLSLNTFFYGGVLGHSPLFFIGTGVSISL